LVYDMADKIIGKISPKDIVQGLEPNYDKINKLKKDHPNYSHNFPEGILESMREQLRLWEKPLGELCKKAYRIRIEDFIKLPVSSQMVNADDELDKAFHLFVVGRHDSLFVLDGPEIVGLIRFSDVYRKIKEIVKACPMADN
jgi:hypothetical protein